MCFANASPLSNALAHPTVVVDAVCDGRSHPLSSYGFATVADAWAGGFPAATSIDDEADWATIQHALDTKGAVHLPPGVCRIGQHHLTITAAPGLRGTGSVTRIVTDNVTGDILVLGNGRDELDNVVVADLILAAAVHKTAGAAVRAVSTIGRARFEHVLFGTLEDAASAGGSLLYDGLAFDTMPNFGEIRFDGKVTVAHDGFSLANGSEFVITDATRIVGGAAGIHARGNVGGLKLTGGADISAARIGVLFDTTATPIPNREFLADGTVSIDGNLDIGIAVRPGSLAVMKLTGTWVADSPVCIEVMPGQPAGSRWTMAGLHVDKCVRTGLAIADGLFDLSGSILTRSGTSGSGSPFFAVVFTTGRGTVVVGNVFANNSPALHDLCACEGADYFVVANNVLGGFTNIPGASPSRRLVRDNIGVSDPP